MSGVTTEGFVPKRLQDILAELRERHRADLGAEPGEVIDQIDGVYAEREAAIWELAETVHQAGRMLAAAGTDLDALAAMVGLLRAPATETRVDVLLTGDPTTVITAGSLATLAANGEVFEVVEEVELDGAGEAVALLKATTTGPIQVLAGATWEITTPISGWDSVSNAEDGETGRDVQSDAGLRETILRTFSGGGQSAAAIRAAVLRLRGIVECKVAENPLYTTDANGLPPKSFEVIVRAEDADDGEIATAIWENKPTGIETYGTTSEVVVDSENENRTVNFSHATELEAYVEVDIEPTGLFPADGVDLIVAEILEVEASLGIGVKLSAWSLARRIETDGISSLAIRIGLSASPPTDNSIDPGPRRFVVLDSSRIQINVL